MYQEAKRNKFDNNIASLQQHGRSATTSNLFALKTQRTTGKTTLSSTKAHSSLQLSETIDDPQYSASQLSSGYESNFSSTVGCSPTKKPRSAKKSDENFYNSFNFISPVKKPMKDAKKILKEKSSSENVIRCSTPVQNKNAKRGLWGRFRSLHPEKVQSSVEFEPLKSLDLNSFDAASSFSSFDLSDVNSFNQLPEDEGINCSKRGFKQLLTGSLQKLASLEESIAEHDEQSPVGELRAFKNFNYCGREKVDILGKLNEKQISLEHTVLKYLSFNDLLHLSEVSKQYRDTIRSIKSFETKRLSQIEVFKKNAENALPADVDKTSVSKLSPVTLRKEKRKFGNFNNINIELKTVSPPVSPSRRKFHENQKVSLF